LRVGSLLSFQAPKFQSAREILNEFFEEKSKDRFDGGISFFLAIWISGAVGCQTKFGILDRKK